MVKMSDATKPPKNVSQTEDCTIVRTISLKGPIWWIRSTVEVVLRQNSNFVVTNQGRLTYFWDSLTLKDRSVLQRHCIFAKILQYARLFEVYIRPSRRPRRMVPCRVICSKLGRYCEYAHKEQTDRAPTTYCYESSSVHAYTRRRCSQFCHIFLRVHPQERICNQPCNHPSFIR